jgi:hypothetical protein
MVGGMKRPLALVFALAACGPNYRYAYEGEGAFERCYALDYDNAAAPETRQQCWAAWLQSYSFGAGVDRRLHASFEERFGFPLVEAWAMTETGNGAVVIANHEPRHVGTNCFGRPMVSPALLSILKVLGRPYDQISNTTGTWVCAGKDGIIPSVST